MSTHAALGTSISALGSRIPYWKQQYYVSNSGTDEGTGTIADPITPAGLAAKSLIAGTKIYFNKGETYNAFTLNVDADNVTLDAYGTGDAPIISGSSIIATGYWTSEGGGVYSVAKANVKWLYFDDGIVENAKTTYMQCASRPAANIIRVSAANKTYLNAFTSLVGLKVRSFDNGNFRLTFPYTITDYNSTTGDITLDRNMAGSTGANYFFIANYVEFLANEKWSWDDTTLKFKTATTIADHVIRVGTIDNGINITANNCTVKNLSFKHYQRTAIKCYDKTVNVLDCTIHDMRGNAVYVYGNNAIINAQRNTIYNVGNNGIYCGAVASGTILDNIIHHIGVGVDIGWPVTDAFASVDGYPYISNFGTTDDVIMYTGRGMGFYYQFTEPYFLNDSIICRYNTLYNIAGDGIVVGGDNHLIEYNRIYNYNQIFDDCAAIHTGASDAATLRDSSCHDVSVKMNSISTPGKLSSWTILGTLRSVGIYTDQGCTLHTIDGNVIYDGASGTEAFYFWTNNTNHEVKNNIVANYGTSAFGGYNSPTITNLKVHHNVFYGTSISLIAIYASFYSAGGYFDYNTYISPSRDTVFKLNTTNYTLADWKTATSQDANSTIQTLYRVLPPSNDYLVYNNLTKSQVTVDITAGYKDLNGDDISSATLAAYASVLVLRKYAAALLFADNFNGTTINAAKWTETDPDSRISQNEFLTISNLHNKAVALWDDNLLGSVSIASGVAVASGYLSWTPTGPTETLGGIYLYKDASNYACINSGWGNGVYRLRIFTGGVNRYDVSSTIAQGKTVKIWTDGTTIKFYYWNTSTLTWTQMGTTQTFSLGYPLLFAITMLDATTLHYADGIYLDNVSLVASEYSTLYPE